MKKYGPIWGREWSEQEMALLREDYQRLGPNALCPILQRSYSAVSQKAHSMGLAFYPRHEGRPPRQLYLAALQVAADKLGIGMDDALGCSRKRAIVRARWRAWDTLYATGKYSTTGIGLTSGFHHATILSGMKRLRREQRPAP